MYWMNALLFVGVMLLIGRLAIFSNSPRRSVYFCTSLLCLMILWMSCLGYARPGMMFGVSDGQLLGVSLDEGRAIYVLVKPDHATQPILYALPWSEKKADQVLKTQEEAAKGKQKVRFSFRGGGTCLIPHSCQMNTYIEKQKPLPPKTKEIL